MYIPYRFPVKRNKDNHSAEWLLSLEKYNEYRASYPSVDIDQEFRKMRQWCLDNPRKRKTPTGMPKFINTWLSKTKVDRKAYARSYASFVHELTDRSWAD